jgi:hypothetical protein
VGIGVVGFASVTARDVAASIAPIASIARPPSIARSRAPTNAADASSVVIDASNFKASLATLARARCLMFE